eukprot:PhM_4_TR14866/c0_g1_i1/m.86529
MSSNDNNNTRATIFDRDPVDGTLRTHHVPHGTFTTVADLLSQLCLSEDVSGILECDETGVPVQRGVLVTSPEAQLSPHKCYMITRHSEAAGAANYPPGDAYAPSYRTTMGGDGFVVPPRVTATNVPRRVTFDFRQPIAATAASSSARLEDVSVTYATMDGVEVTTTLAAVLEKARQDPLTVPPLPQMFVAASR